MDFNVKVMGVEKALEMYAPRVVMQAANRSLDRIGPGVISETAKEITAAYNIRTSTVKEKMRVRKIREGSAISTIEVIARGKGLPLAAFGAKQKGVQITKGSMRYTKRAARSGSLRHGAEVTVMVKKGQERTIVRGKYGRKPFLTTARGRAVVWERKTRARFPVGEHLGPGVGGLFGSKAISPNIQAYVSRRWQAEFPANLKHYLGR